MAPLQEQQWLTPLSFSLLISVAGCIITSIWCLSSGYTSVFQNLFYIPIIIASLFYQRKGFILSCILAISYFALVVFFIPDQQVLIQAGIRTLVFIGVALVISYLADILKKTEILRSTARVQETIVRNAQVWLMGLDQDLRVRVWNTAAEEMSGYPAEEVLGRENIWELLYPDPGYREEVIGRLPLDGSENRELTDYTTQVRTRNGEERVISWNAKVLPEWDDTFLRYIIIGVDLTEKERLSREYRRQSLFLQTLIETFPFPVFSKDLDGVYTGCNSSFESYFGKSRDEFIGKSSYDLWSPEMAEMYHQDDQDVFTSPAPRQYESRVRFPNGSEHDVIVYKAPIRDESYQVTGLVGALLDITERKRIEDALVLTNRKLNLLSGITRHDIGNKLQVIFGYVEVAREYEMDSDLRKLIELIDTVAHHIGHLIAFTRDYQDIGVMSPVWQNVHTIISQACREIDITPVEVTIGIDDMEVFADPLIDKVFYNLIDNAKRYGGKITRIWFHGSLIGGRYIIFCEDDGVGVQEEFKEKIFRREYYQHTGFGLNLSREILDITGITITETGIPGEGARFEISVPKGMFRTISWDEAPGLTGPDRFV